jgi:hypothetical protein
MLDDRERRILADLERELVARKPFAADPWARGARVLGPPWWPLGCIVVGIAVAVFLMTLGLVGNALLLLTVAAAPIAPRLLRRLRRPGPPGPAGRCDPGRDGCQPTER